MPTMYHPDGRVIGVADTEWAMSIWTRQGFSTSKPSSSSSGVSSGSGSGASSVINSVVSAKEKRRQHVASLTVSTIPEVAAIQKQSQDEFVETGKWNPVYEQRAEAIRKGLNPMYPGGGKGFTDPQFFLPGAGSDTPALNGFGSFFDVMFGTAGNAAGQVGNPSNNGVMLLAAGGILLLLLGRR